MSTNLPRRKYFRRNVFRFAPTLRPGGVDGVDSNSFTEAGVKRSGAR
ncbi:MAG: hypothetical protein AB8F74_06220 [Saprospiraceae bacterium]